jgi:hypothetical protein
MRAYVARTKTDRDATTRRWMEQNAERVRTYKREWSQQNAPRLNAKSREWAVNNPERRKATLEKYAETHPEQKRAMHRQRRYGLDQAGFDALWAQQDGKCALCEIPLTLGRWNGRGTAHVDHDHETNRVRGLLCMICNHMLGIVNDSPAMLRKMADYLERHS